MSWLLTKPTTVATTPPPGVRLPWWDRTKPRRAGSHLGRASRVIAHNPRYLTTTGLCALTWLGWPHIGIWAPTTAFLLGIIALTLWTLKKPQNVKQAAMGWWRSNRRYRWTWSRTLRRCDAAKLDVPVPLLLRVRSTSKNRRPLVDKLLVKVPTGLDPTAFHDYRGELLQWGWRGLSTRVINPQHKNQTVELWNLINDPLIEPVPPFPQPTEALPKQGWQLARLEDGEPWHLKIRGGAAHTFICGISGAGKGSYIGAVLDQAHKGIQDRTVEAWGVDPQASELGMWRHLFAKLVFTQDDAASLLEELVDIMDKRTRSMFGITRQHQPTPADPFYEVILDEGLDLLDKTDRNLYRRIDTALRQLLRKGRKASIRISFISQRAELETVEIRKDFPISIAFQLRIETDVDMVLGRGALKAGAKAHELKLPGEVLISTERGLMRARFPYFTDDYIRELAPAPGNENPANLATVPADDHYGFA